MKNKFLILLLCSCLSYSQNLSFEEFLSLKNKNAVEANFFLNGKGWHLFSELEPELDKQGIVVFKMQEEKSNRDFWHGETLMECRSYKNANVSELKFITASEEIFRLYVNHIKRSNYKVVSSSSNNKVKSYTYQNDKLTIQTNVGSFLKKIYYEITIIDRINI